MEQYCIRLERKQTETNRSRGLYMEGEFLTAMVELRRALQEMAQMQGE